MNIILNTTHKMCLQNRTVLKCLWVTPDSEAHRISIFKKYYHVTFNMFSNDSFKRNVQKNLDSLTLHIFRKTRKCLSITKDYERTFAKPFVPGALNYKLENAENEICTDLSNLTSKRALHVFTMLSLNALRENKYLSDGKHEEIISLLIKKCKLYQDNELRHLLKNLELWPDIGINQWPYNSVRKLLEEIDDTLNERSEYWPIEKTLLYCDTVCNVFTFHSNFVANSMRRFTEDPSKLSYQNIVQIMYCLFVYNVPQVQIRRMEPYVENYFDKFSIEELGIICMGFFRSQVKITSDTLLCKLMQKIIDNVDTIDNQSLGQIFKQMRYSFVTKPNCLETCVELMNVIIPRVADISENSVTHLSHLAANSNICNPQLLSAILERFTANLGYVRLKDMERILFFMTTFNIPSSHPLYNLIVKELGTCRRKKEKKKFPKALGFSLRFLALVNIYPLDLLSTVMSHEHIRLAYGSNPHSVGVEYFILDQSIEIEVPTYEGPRLGKEICNILYEKAIVPEKASFAACIKEQIIEILNRIFKSEDVACLERILPHFTQTDIILCLENNNNAIPPENILKTIKSHVKRVPQTFQNLKWIAIIFATETLLLRESNEFTGNLSGKIRQLEKVGYIPIVVPHVEWKVLYSDFQKCKYIKNKISEATKRKPLKSHVFEKYNF